MLSFKVPGKVQGKARHRARIAAGAGGKQFVQTYKAAEDTTYESWIRDCFTQQCDVEGRATYRGPFRISILAVFDVPRDCWTGTGKISAKGHRTFGAAYLGKPDSDNILKLVCDALNGIGWHDDAQGWSTGVVKIYRAEDDDFVGLDVDIFYQDQEENYGNQNL